MSYTTETIFHANFNSLTQIAGVILTGSLWADNTAGQIVHIKSITVTETSDDGDGSSWQEIFVEHDGESTVYSDEAFENTVTQLCGFNASWSEWGMQHNQNGETCIAHFDVN